MWLLLYQIPMNSHSTPLHETLWTKFHLCSMWSMSFIALVFTKIIDAQWHSMYIFYTEFQPNQTKIQTVWVILMFLSPTNALLYYTYKMLKYTVKISHDCSYMFLSIWTIIRGPMLNLAKVTILCRYSVKIRR